MTDQEKKVPNYMKFIIGGLAGMTATVFVQPMDLIKTRMQMTGVGTAHKEYKNSIDIVLNVLKEEGLLKFYRGIGAGLLRQATYTTTRMGVYQTINDMYKDRTGLAIPSTAASIIMGLTAGASGAFVGTPAEVALIRMMVDGKLPASERRNYRNVIDALVRIHQEEGIKGLWTGCLPTVGRAMVVNMCQLASYSQFKSALHNSRLQMDGILLHACASCMSGLLTSVASMPLDIAKTRLQNMKTPPDGKPEYSGSIDVLIKVAKNEGVLALWKGFTPYLLRICPHTILTLVFLEQYNRLYRFYVLGSDGGSSL
uniref:Mitochondrial 2-oxoglutarate/malate carrier protein n=1 Tax=Glossina palpalis gambiensis TaxID=67801 RepID=A0A1B0AZ08_9MUSC